MYNVLAFHAGSQEGTGGLKLSHVSLLHAPAPRKATHRDSEGTVELSRASAPPIYLRLPETTNPNLKCLSACVFPIRITSLSLLPSRSQH